MSNKLKRFLGLQTENAPEEAEEYVPSRDNAEPQGTEDKGPKVGDKPMPTGPLQALIDVRHRAREARNFHINERRRVAAEMANRKLGNEAAKNR